MPKVSRLEVISTGARRRWTIEEKQRIVAESFAVRRNVSATARRYGLSASQLFYWRQLARAGKFIGGNDVPAFVPALVAVGQEHAGAVAAVTGRMEIILSGTAGRVIVGSDVDATALLRVIGALVRA